MDLFTLIMIPILMITVICVVCKYNSVKRIAEEAKAIATKTLTELEVFKYDIQRFQNTLFSIESKLTSIEDKITKDK